MKRIILIVGASGVGKDTLLRGVRDKVKANFIKRYITRKSDSNEENFYVDSDAFKTLRKIGFFVASWEAHTNHYGIAKNQIKDGINIISVSRAAIKDFEKAYRDVTTISITLPKEVLKQRLKERGRETKEQIKERLSRSYSSLHVENLIEFDNSSSLEVSLKNFERVLSEI